MCPSVDVAVVKDCYTAVVMTIPVAPRNVAVVERLRDRCSVVEEDPLRQAWCVAGIALQAPNYYTRDPVRAASFCAPLAQDRLLVTCAIAVATRARITGGTMVVGAYQKVCATLGLDEAVCRRSVEDAVQGRVPATPPV